MSILKSEEYDFFWNQRALKKPAISTFKFNKTDTINLNQFHNLIKEAATYFTDTLKPFKFEYQLLKRCIYRQTPKFRSSKAFKALLKLNKALGRLFENNLTRILNNILSLIPKEFVPEETYLPTKNLIDHLLVRLLGIAKLLVRIVETACICYELYSIRVRIGHFWQMAAIMIGLVSRIFVIAKDQVRFICDFYTILLPYSNKLENHGPQWLPSSKVLPADIKKWLQIDNRWLESKEPEIIEIFDTTIVDDEIEYMDLVDDDSDVEFLDEYVELDESIHNNGQNWRKRRKRMLSNASNDIIEMRGFVFDDSKLDIGQVIEIDDHHHDDENIVEIKDEDTTNSMVEEIINLDTTAASDDCDNNDDTGVEIIDITNNSSIANNSCKSMPDHENGMSSLNRKKRKKLRNKLKKQRNLLKSAD